MDQLSVTNHNITGVTNQRDSTLQTLTTRFCHEFINIDFAQFMRTRHNLDAIDCSAAINLRHKIKTVNVLIEVVAVPMSNAILVP